MDEFKRQKSPQWARTAIAAVASLVLLLSVFVVSAEVDFHDMSSPAVAAQSLDTDVLDPGQSDIGTGAECHVSTVCTATLVADEVMEIHGMDRDPKWPVVRQLLRSSAAPEHFHPPRLFS